MSAKKDPASLKSLPIEIKEKIFNYLQLPDLFNLTLTCKQLNDSIGKSQKLMNKFEIKLSKVQEGIISSRMYTRVIVDVETEEGSKPVQLIKKALPNFHKSVKELIFVNFWFSTHVEFPKTFAEMCLEVETISLKQFKVMRSFISRKHDFSKHFPKLRVLDMYCRVSSRLFEAMPQVIKVTFHDDVSFYPIGALDSLVNVQQLKVCNKTARRKVVNFSRYSIDFSDNDFNDNLRILILQDCDLDENYHFKRLEEMKLINCTIRKGFAPIPKSCEIGKLYIENCKPCYFVERLLESEIKVKHLSLINLKLPEREQFQKLIQAFRPRLEKLRMKKISYYK